MICRLPILLASAAAAICAASTQATTAASSIPQTQLNDTERKLIRDEGAAGAAIGGLICQTGLFKEYSRALIPEMEFQVKKNSKDCTVAYFPNKCKTKGDCPKENQSSDIWWNNGCGVRTPSISMGLQREGACWVECDKFDKDVVMAHNCGWEEKNGVWKFWGTAKRDGIFCPGCELY